jgi:ABC-type multidrug transport system ATPase subunit
MQTKPAVVLSGVSRAYRAGVRGCAAAIEVLRDLSLDVPPGDFTIVEGAAGAGKTTFLLCAAGLLRPDTGKVEWPLFGARGSQSPKDVRYVGDRAPTYGFLTVRESLAYATTLREIDDPGGRLAPSNILDLAGLTYLTGVRVALLSRAERARLLIGLALVSSPQLILVDDLTADCDAAGSGEFGAVLSRVALTGAAVVWAARNAHAFPAARAFELVRGKLRPRVPVARSDDSAPPETSGIATATQLRHAQRVAEP